MLSGNPVERESLMIEQPGRASLGCWQLRGLGCVLLCSHMGRRYAALAELMAGI